MRWASFFILSMSLHAAALLYPVSFAARGQEQFLRVTILPEAADQGAGDRPKNGGASPARVAAQRAPRLAAQLAKKKSAEQTQLLSASVESAPSFTAADAAVFSSPANESEPKDGKPSLALGQSNGGFGGASSGAGNGGLVASAGSGAGAGNGNGGANFAEKPAALTQVRYRDTPQPNYPESARREGRQGNVLLRVLVDEQGRSKKIEINRSSGSAALDRAAAEAIQRWRFIPARYGDRPVESWIRIPIDFSLVDADAR